MTDRIKAAIEASRAREKKARCPRTGCGAPLVHDFEEGCWVCDRCTGCGATWWNDTPGRATDAPFFRDPEAEPRFREALAVAVEAMSEECNCDIDPHMGHLTLCRLCETLSTIERILAGEKK